MDSLYLHYIYPGDDGKIKSKPFAGSDGTVFSTGGTYAIACLPNQPCLTSKVRATDAAIIVTCPKCKLTDIYKEHMENPGKKQGGLSSILQESVENSQGA